MADVVVLLVVVVIIIVVVVVVVLMVVMASMVGHHIVVVVIIVVVVMASVVGHHIVVVVVIVVVLGLLLLLLEQIVNLQSASVPIHQRDFRGVSVVVEFGSHFFLITGMDTGRPQPLPDATDVEIRWLWPMGVSLNVFTGFPFGQLQGSGGQLDRGCRKPGGRGQGGGDAALQGYTSLHLGAAVGGTLQGFQLADLGTAVGRELIGRIAAGAQGAGG